MALKTGIVRFFDSRDNKRFGFISIGFGQDIFFHLNDQRSVVVDVSGDTVFTPINSGGKVPKVGDRIVFTVARGDGGRPKASPWTFEEDCLRLNERHPFRFVVQSFGEPEVLWEGSDVSDAARRFPPEDRDEEGKNVYVMHDMNSGTYGWFERKVGSGWVSCSDPCPRSTD